MILEKLICSIFGCSWQSAEGILPDYCDRCGAMDLEEELEESSDGE